MWFHKDGRQKKLALRRDVPPHRKEADPDGWNLNQFLKKISRKFKLISYQRTKNSPFYEGWLANFSQQCISTRPSTVGSCYTERNHPLLKSYKMHWNLSKTDTIGAKKLYFIDKCTLYRDFSYLIANLSVEGVCIRLEKTSAICQIRSRRIQLHNHKIINFINCKKCFLRGSNLFSCVCRNDTGSAP